MRAWIGAVIVAAGCSNSSPPPAPISNKSTDTRPIAASPIETWTGTGFQPDADLRFSIELQIRRDVPVGETLGTIEYTGESLHCGGDLIRIASAEGVAVVERLTTNPGDQCVDGGTIVLHIKGESLDWEWSYPNGTVGATAKLLWTRR